MAKGLSSTQRTLRVLRERGLVCAIVEKWNRFAGPFGCRQDLFGIIDVLGLDPQKGVIGAQCCVGATFRQHYEKITKERYEETKAWLSTPGCSLEIWAWRKIKLERGGKAMRWEPKVRQITLGDLENVVASAPA